MKYACYKNGNIIENTIADSKGESTEILLNDTGWGTWRMTYAKGYRCQKMVCKYCGELINGIYAIVYDKVKVVYHLECFHKDYTLQEEKIKV